MIEILSIKGMAVAIALAGAVVVWSKANTITPAPTAITQPIEPVKTPTEKEAK
jgi:hypothetical protein